MKSILKIFLMLIPAVYVSCIRNDIPYPVVELSITSVEGDGFTCSPSDIDFANRTVVIHLDETTDISKVRISGVGFTEGATADVSFPGEFDMRSDLHVILELYQQYDWIIRAEQTISRSFVVEGQIGVSEIDSENFTARASVPKGTDLDNIRILEMKLGPEGITTYNPEMSDITSFETYRTVDVSYHDFSERWSLFVEETDILANINSAVAGTRVMWLEGSGVPDTDLGFRYRKSGDSDWTEVSDADMTVSGGTISAYVGGLEPMSEYEVIAYSGENISATVTVTTGAEALLPNSDFEDWATLDGIVCPYLTADDAFWGTGNPGAAIVSMTLTDRTDDTRPGSSGSYAAKLDSKLAGIMGIGRFASGNIFVGSYMRTVGMSGLVGFGRPFTERPTALSGWMKYTQGNITDLNDQPAGSDLKIGDPDSGIIYIALGNWTPEEYGISSDGEMVGTGEIPVIVDTRDVNTFFNKDADAVIAYGELVLDHTVEDWQEFTINLEYRKYDVQPTHIIVICTSSRYGDYFTGSTDSKMWVDDFSLEYDKVTSGQ